MLLALHASLLSLASVLISLYPAATVVLAIVVLRERVTRWQAVGHGAGAGLGRDDRRRLTSVRSARVASCTRSVAAIAAAHGTVRPAHRRSTSPTSSPGLFAVVGRTSTRLLRRGCRTRELAGRADVAAGLERARRRRAHDRHRVDAAGRRHPGGRHRRVDAQACAQRHRRDERVLGAQAARDTARRTARPLPHDDGRAARGAVEHVRRRRGTS